MREIVIFQMPEMHQVLRFQPWASRDPAPVFESASVECERALLKCALVDENLAEWFIHHKNHKSPKASSSQASIPHHGKLTPHRARSTWKCHTEMLVGPQSRTIARTAQL